MVEESESDTDNDEKRIRTKVQLPAIIRGSRHHVDCLFNKGFIFTKLMLLLCTAKKVILALNQCFYSGLW